MFFFIFYLFLHARNKVNIQLYHTPTVSTICINLYLYIFSHENKKAQNVDLKIIFKFASKSEDYTKKRQKNCLVVEQHLKLYTKT